MDLRHMRQFIAVAEELHFGRAAKRLNMAQPPLSQSIKRLEMKLGVELLGRTRSEVWMTEAGKVFLEEARRTLMQAELARTVTQRVANAVGGRINVSFIGPALFRLLPPPLLAHNRAHPDVQIRLFERSSPQQLEGILRGEFDIAFLHPSIDLLEGGERKLVERARFVAAVPAEWPLAAQPSVTLAELATQPMIMPPHKEAPSRVAEMMTAYRGVGTMPHIAQEAMQTNSTLGLVAAGMGCATVPGSAALTGRRGVAFRPITDIPAYWRWELEMAWRPQHLSPAAAQFLDIVSRHVDAHAELLDLDAPLLD